MGTSRLPRSSLSSTEVGFSLWLASELILLFANPLKIDNWSFRQYIESPVRSCPRRGIEWSHAVTTFRLAARTVYSNDLADLAQPSSSMTLFCSRCSRSFYCVKCDSLLKMFNITTIDKMIIKNVKM